MDKRTFYFTLIFFLVCLAGIGFAIYEINQATPESEEGALMINTCDEVSTYETIKAEQDLEELSAIIKSHIKEYPGETQASLLSALEELDSLRDEVAFHNTNEEMYKSHFREILNQISYAELLQASVYLAQGKEGQAMESVRHAQHCLHDALFFTKKSAFDEQANILHQLNLEKNGGLTISGLEQIAAML